MRGSGTHPPTAALFPSPIHAKFLSLGKLRKALCQRVFNSYTSKIHPHDFKKTLKCKWARILVVHQFSVNDLVDSVRPAPNIFLLFDDCLHQEGHITTDPISILLRRKGYKAVHPQKLRVPDCRSARNHRI